MSQETITPFSYSITLTLLQNVTPPQPLVVRPRRYGDEDECIEQEFAAPSIGLAPTPNNSPIIQAITVSYSNEEKKEEEPPPLSLMVHYPCFRPSG